MQRRPISIEESVKLLKAAIKYEDNVLAAIGRAAPTQSDFTAAKASIFGAHYALVLIVQRGSQPGSAIRDDLNKALAYDSTASTTLDGNKTEGVASALAAARALKEKALTLLTTGEQPAPGATQHTVTEQLQITLVAPSAEPAVETFVVKFLVAQPTVESVIADLGHVPEKFDGLVQITSQNPTPGTTQVTVKGAVVEPGGAPAASGPLVIGLKIGSKATTVKLDGPVVVRKLTTKEQKAVICDIFAPDRVATVRVATKLDGSPVPRSGLVSQCKKTLAPKISTPATTTTPKTTSSGTVTPNGPAGGGAYIATIKNPPGRFQMTLPPSYTFASYGAAHGWGCLIAGNNTTIDCTQTDVGFPVQISFATSPPLAAEASGKIKVSGPGFNALTLKGP